MHHCSNLLLEDESPVMREFRRIVTDTNIMSLTLTLDELSPLYAQLLAVALYSNKLDMICKYSEVLGQKTPADIQHLIYGFFEKECLEELILACSEDEL